MAILTSEIKFWYELNDGSGTSLADANGGTAGTLIPGSTITWEAAGKAVTNNLKFTGGVVNDRGESGTTVGNQVAFTVFGWFYTAGSTNPDGLVSIKSTTTGHYVPQIYKDTSDHMVARINQLGMGNVYAITSSGTYGNSAYHFYVFQQNGSGSGEFFIDNTSIGTGTSNNAMPDVVAIIGNAYDAASGGGDFGWKGKMSQVAWINRALDSTERSDLYNSGNGKTYASYFAATPTNNALLFAGS